MSKEIKEEKNSCEVTDDLDVSSEESERLRKLTCAACQTIIADEYIMRVANRSWHANCLTCSECGCQLANTCYYKSECFYCTQHVPFFAHCSGCEAPLQESEYIHRSANCLYHISCFQCISCGQPIEKGDDYYMLENTGKLMCKADYDIAQRKDYENGNKRPRTTISAMQLEALKKAYRDGSKPPRIVREKLAKQTGLDSRVVQVWFQNRRAKEKRVTKDHNDGADNSQYDYMLDETLHIPPICMPTQIPSWPSNLPHDSQFSFTAPNIMGIIHNLGTAPTYDFHMTL